MAEVKTEIIYRMVDGEHQPVLSIQPKVKREGHIANFAIRLEDLWMYARDKNPDYDKWMYKVVNHIYRQFNLGVIVSTQRMAEVASVIEDAIDDLIKAPPEPPAGSMEKAFNRAVAEAKVNGKTVEIY
jgi:hypothetical protein